MQDLIFLLPLLVVIILYYIFIDHIDEYIASQEELFNEEEFTSKDVLLYKNIEDITAILKTNHVVYDVIEYPSFPQFCCYKIVLGISESDLDNLLVCKIAKRFNPAVQTIAKCNLQIYHEIFDCEDVDVVVSSINEAMSILNEWEVIC